MLRTPKTARSRRLRTRGRAACHRLLGRLLFRCGRLQPARQQFERVLDLRGDDFQAYVHLGRIAYKLGDYAGWRRECGHARRTAPERFARLRHPFELFEQSRGEVQPDPERLIASGTFRTADRARSESKGVAPATGCASDDISATGLTPDDLDSGDVDLGDLDLGDRDLGARDPGTCGHDRVPTDELVGEGTDGNEGPHQPHSGTGQPDDFLSGRERRAFRARGPIQIDELRAVDLDDLAARLTDGA